MSALFSPGDFTGEGTSDLLATNGAGELILYPNTGGGNVVNGPVVGTGWQAMRDISSPGTVPPGVRVFSPGAGDVNADGAGDVLARTNSGSLLVYQGDGRAGWRSVTVVAPAWGASTFVTLADFDGNGTPDLARLDPSGGLSLVPGNSAGGYSAEKLIGVGWARFTSVFGGIDFDGDRRTDILARDADGTLYLYRGNGAGGWMTGVGQAVGTGWGIFDTVFTIGDFDGNHRAAVAARKPDGTLWLYPTTGAGSWGQPRQIGSGWSGITAVFSPGNFDGTGGPDVMARMPNGDLRLYRGDGKGSWAGVSVIGTAWSPFSQIG